MAARTRALIEAPIGPLLVRMAAPNLAIMAVQSLGGLIQVYFIGYLGIEALAGTALVFPAIMLMQMMSAGAMGGAVSSAVARALGAGRIAAAEGVVWHALVLYLAIGVVFTAAVLLGGPRLYAAMGGEGATLAAALAYSDLAFAGIVLVWLFNALASVLRGTGNMMTPALVTCIGTVALVPLSPLLIFGGGPVPAMGVAGGAAALLIFYAGGAAVLAAAVWSGRNLLRPRLAGTRLAWGPMREILRIGAPAALTTVLANLTVAVVTSLIADDGADAIAGYGLAARLDYLLIPLVFGLGAPLVAMVGTCTGRGAFTRARRAAWLGATLAVALTESIGVAAALWPAAWIGLFSDAPDVIAAGSAYLEVVGPAYGFFGLGTALYFAAQGAGRMRMPLAASIARFVLAAAGGALAVAMGGGLVAVAGMVAASLIVFGLVNAGAVALGWPRGEMEAMA